ncbi:MAG TPA: F0F1 ATP synthase subunit beta, partial [Clostridia bacterium]|nr:F0F1 ATP synthase subunit beta [Clostridia bacterium]
IEGRLVDLEDALDGCERILKDEFKDYDETDLYLIGTIEEAVEKRNKRGADNET